MISTLQRPLSARARIALLRAADELLIDAIFGNTFRPIRDGEPVLARPARAARCRVAAPEPALHS